MSASDINLSAKFRGCLLGLTVGDALGFPWRGRSREYVKVRVRALEQGFDRHESGFFPPGQYSDDSQTALAVVTSILESNEVNGQTIAEHLIPLWRDQLVVDPPSGTSAAIVDVLRGRVAFEDSGQMLGCLGADAMPRAVPLGLWERSPMSRVATSAACCCSVTHRDPRVLATAAGTAAVVAHLIEVEEVVLGVFLKDVAEAVGKYHGQTAAWVIDFPRLLSITEYRVFEQVGRYVAEETGEPPRRFNEGVPDNCLFVFLLALYYFLKAPFDFKDALEHAVGAGGEVTTIGALVGAFSGALLGDHEIPNKLLESVHERESTLKIIEAFYQACENKDGT